MRTGTRGIDLIKKWEGCVLHPYKDIAGYPTIGYGHLIKSGEKFGTITQDEATALLQKDVAPCEDVINKLVKAPLGQNQFDALVCWLFNVGTGALSVSSVLRDLNAGHPEKVPDDLCLWCKVVINGQKVTNQGLLARRKSEGTLFMAPEDDHGAAEQALTDAEKAYISGLVAYTCWQVIQDDGFLHDRPSSPDELA